MSTETLNDITRAEADAQEAAAKATAAAEVARAKAEDARQRADQVRADAYREFLDKIAAEWPAAREAALTVAGECRTTLEDAVRNGDDVFRAYLRWVDASIHVWEVDSELSQIRDFHGQSVRSTDPPAFNFGMDVGAIVDLLSAELQDAAVTRITDRRTAFVNGRTA